MGFILGLDAELGYDVLGATNNTFVLASNVKDLTINMEAATDDVSTRGGNGFRQVAATLKDGSVEWQQVYDTTEASFIAFNEAFFDPAKRVIGLFVADGGLAVIGTEGLKGDFMITNWSVPQNLEEALKVDVTAQLTFSAFVPTWFTVTV